MLNGFRIFKRLAVLAAITAVLLISAPDDYGSLQPANGVVDLNAWSPASNPAIKLGGHWRFFPNRLVSPQQLLNHQDKLSQQAIPLTVPARWNDSVAQKSWPDSGHGTGTYWLTLKGTKPGTPVSLTLNRACSNASIYFFADTTTATPLATLGKVGNSAAQASPYAGSTTVSLPFSNAPVHQLLIQTSNFSFSSGGLCGDITLGTTHYLKFQNTEATIIQTSLVTMIGITALYVLVLLSQNRRSKQALWLMLMCLGSCIFFFSASGLLEKLIFTQHSWLYTLRIKQTYLGLMLASVSLLMFYTGHFSSPLSRRLLNINIGVSLLLSIVIIALPVSLVTSLLPGLTAYWGIEVATGIFVLGQAVWQRRDYSKSMVAAIAPLLVALPHDLYTHAALNKMPLLSLYCLVFFIFVHSLIVGRRFSVATQLADTLSNNLKAEVDIRTAELHEKNRKLEQTQGELEEANEALKKLSITDGLTRIYNRMYFEQEFRKEWRRCARLRKSISILMIDVDHFKQLNDSAGHLAGDQALQVIAKTLNGHFKRAGELVARYGGEEFVVMLPNTSQQKALAIAEGFRAQIEKQAIDYDGDSYNITVSIGISTTTPSMKLSPDHLLAAADSALYQAKNSGRNRVDIIPLLPAAPYHRSRSIPG